MRLITNVGLTAKRKSLAVWIGALMAWIIPVLFWLGVRIEIRHFQEQVKSGSEAEFQQAVDALSFQSVFLHRRAALNEYWSEEDLEKKTRLSKAYEGIFGSDPEVDLEQFRSMD